MSLIKFIMLLRKFIRKYLTTWRKAGNLFANFSHRKKILNKKIATMSGRNAICISLENTMSVPNVIVLLLNIKKSSNNDLILARSLFEANTKLVVTS